MEYENIESLAWGCYKVVEELKEKPSKELQAESHRIRKHLDQLKKTNCTGDVIDYVTVNLDKLYFKSLNV